MVDDNGQSQADSAPVKFGIFDWIYRNQLQLSNLYEQRLQRLNTPMRRASIVITWRSIRVRSCYHLVEHQGTLLGMAPSPRVFLAAVIQRTQAGAAPRGLCSG